MEDKDIIQIPMDIFEEAETKEDLEDWLMANNPTWIEEMRRRAKQLAEGKTRPFSELRKKWPTE